MSDDVPNIPTRSFSEEMNEVFAQRDTSGQVQAIKELFDDEKSLKMKSEISRDQGESFYFSKIFILADVLDCPILSRYGNEELNLRVSRQRLGRSEAVSMTRNTTPDEKKGGFMRRLFG